MRIYIEALDAGRIPDLVAPDPAKLMNSRRSPVRPSITGDRHPSARAGRRADDGEARIVGDFRHDPIVNLSMIPFVMLSTSSENGGGFSNG